MKYKEIFMMTILTFSLSSIAEKTMNKSELLEDFSEQYITIEVDRGVYCIEARVDRFRPINNVEGCQNVDDVTITKTGTVCIESGSINCNKIERKSSGVFWGNSRIRFSQTLGELRKNVTTVDDDIEDAGKSYIKRAKKHFKNKEYYKAYELAKKAANLGNKDGFYGVGLAFEKGYGVEEKDKKEAVKWYRKAAEKGHTKAQLKVAGLVRFDDIDEAVKWLKLAADKDNTSAMNNLGYMWAKGHLSTFGDNKKAYEWFMKSAKLGNKTAQHNVCKSLYFGKGVVKNTREAEKWCQKAVDQGNKKAFDLLERIKMDN